MKKRPVGSPSGSTPGKPVAKIRRDSGAKSRKSLTFGNDYQVVSLQVLLDYCLIHHSVFNHF